MNEREYESMLPDDNECEECERHIRRGDELFDELDQAYKLLSQKEEAFEALADRLRKRDDEISEYVKKFGVLGD